MTHEEAAAIARLTEDMQTGVEQLLATTRAFVELLRADLEERKRTAGRNGDLAERLGTALDDSRRRREGTEAAARRGVHLRLVE